MKEGWKRVKLGECFDFLSGKARPKQSGQYPVYGSNGLIGSASDFLFEDAFIIGRVGAVGELSWCKSRFWASDNTIIAESIDTKLFKQFAYYLLRYSNLKQEVHGSVQPLITKSGLRGIKISLPPLSVQKRIAAVLGALDDKIELNRKMNKNLEEQAQALYKAWFIDFEPFGGKMPKGWKKGTLGEITSRMGTGLNPRRNFVLGHGTNYYVTIKNMGNNRIYLDDKCDKIDDDAIAIINKRSDLQIGDVLFSGIGTIGRTYLITKTPKNWNTSESIFNLRPMIGVSSEYLYLLMLSDDMQVYAQGYAQGSAQKGIRMADLRCYKCVIPSVRGLYEFTTIVKPIIQQVARNNEESDRLAEMRDALLPKLMSGEVEV